MLAFLLPITIIIIISAKEVMLSSALACLLASLLVCSQAAGSSRWSLQNPSCNAGHGREPCSDLVRRSYRDPIRHFSKSSTAVGIGKRSCHSYTVPSSLSFRGLIAYRHLKNLLRTSLSAHRSFDAIARASLTASTSGGILHPVSKK